VIIALSGRRIDLPGTRPPRFPLSNTDLVRERIRKLLQTETVTTLVSSAACGADLLALREATALSLRRRVILPFDRKRFRETSVIDRPGDWSFYDSILDDVATRNDLVTLPFTSDDAAAYAKANRAVLDEALALSRSLGEEVRAMLVWDGKSRGPGDLTEAMGIAARQQGLTVMEVLTLRTCFVVQGFGEKTDLSTGRVLNLDASYEVIKEAVEDAGLRCVRADEIIHSGTIDKPMYEWIYHADLVIADLSTSNVNAVYELGVRYGLRPGLTMIVAENQFKNPFDVGHMLILPYEHLGKDIGRREAARFQQELVGRITTLFQDAVVDSPVYTFLSLCPPCEPAKEESLAETHKTFASSAQPDSPRNANDLLKEARAAMDSAKFLEAKVLLGIVRKLLPRDVYVLQQLALATYKSQSPDPLTSLKEAQGYLRELGPEISNDPETLGLWGAVHKRLWDLTHERAALDISVDAYERGFYLKQDYYSGINYAFLLNVRAAIYQNEGNTPEAVTDFVLARRARRKVLQYCESVLAAGPIPNETKYWIVATMWEAALGLEDKDAAATYKVQATTLSGAAWMLDATTEQLAKLQQLLAHSPLTT
jgi:Tetratricopeptide Repeats-Sensor